jgi:hypothetical protein
MTTITGQSPAPIKPTTRPASDPEVTPKSTGVPKKVGLTLSPKTVPNHLLFEGGDGTTLLVYGRPSPNLADHTQVPANVAVHKALLVRRLPASPVT